MSTVESIDYFPKLHAPFKRERTESGKHVTRVVNNGYEWVFDDADRVLAVEKLDGENVSVTIAADGTPTGVYRRNGVIGESSANGYGMAEVPVWSEGHSHYIEGVANAHGQGWIDYLDLPGQFFGELVGPKMQGNRYDLDRHYWVPFDYARERLVYESYGDYPTDYETIRDWMLDYGLPSLFYSRMHGGMPFDEVKDNVTVEGLVFTHPDPDSIDSLTMAKLRNDMFPEHNQ